MNARHTILCVIAAVLVLAGCSAVTPLNYEDHIKLWKSYREQAFQAENRGDLPKAEELYQTALKEGRLFGRLSSPNLNSLNDLAELKQLQHDNKSAMGLYEEAWSIYQDDENAQARGKGERRLPESAALTTITALADLYRDDGQTPKAEELYKKGLEIVKSNQALSLAMLPIVAGYARLLMQTGREAEAKELLFKMKKETNMVGGTPPRAAELFKSLQLLRHGEFQPWDPKPGAPWAEYELIAERVDSKRYPELAIKVGDKAVQMAQEFGPDDLRLARALQHRADIAGTGSADAVRCMKWRLAILERTVGRFDLATFETLSWLAVNCYSHRDYAQGDSVCRDLLRRIAERWPHGGPYPDRLKANALRMLDRSLRGKRK